MYEASDTATTNAILRAAVLPQRTTIDFAQQNYMVLEVCYFLEKLGIKIHGIGTKALTIEGNPNIKADIEYSNSEDPVEAMLFITAAIMTGSKLIIQRAPIDFLKVELLKLEKMGLRYSVSSSYLSYNNRTKLVDLSIKPSKLKALHDKIHAQPYPGINTDNLPFFVPKPQAPLLYTTGCGRIEPSSLPNSIDLVETFAWPTRTAFLSTDLPNSKARKSSALRLCGRL